MHRASAAGYEPAPGTRTTLPAGAPGRSRTAFSRLRNERVTVNASGARTRPATPLTTCSRGPPALSTVRESNSRHRFGRPGPNRSDNGARERSGRVEPPPPTWRAGVRPRTPRTRNKVEAESGVEPLPTEVAARRLPTWRLGHVEETGRVEPPGPWPARLARECAKPACTSSPSRKAEGSNLSGSAPRPGFSGPVAGHSAAPSSTRTRW